MFTCVKILTTVVGATLSGSDFWSSGGSSVSQNKSPQPNLGYIYFIYFKIPSKQLHWLDFILLKFITYDIVILNLKLSCYNLF